MRAVLRERMNNEEELVVAINETVSANDKRNTKANPLKPYVANGMSGICVYV